MRLNLPVEFLRGYRSGSQRARVVTEPWAAENLYCPSCPSPRLLPLKTNTPAKDFCYPDCDEVFQLKGQKKPLTHRISDSAYKTMSEAVRSGETPSFFGLHYDAEEWVVRNLVLIPRFVLSLSAIHKRKPLSARAERRGWVGCDILLDAIPNHARISVVEEGVTRKPQHVREEFADLRGLKRRRVENRGWVMDVLKVVQDIGKPEFLLAEVYEAQGHLKKLHPNNRHIRDKIRQQLQVLRDLGFVEFLGGGGIGCGSVLWSAGRQPRCLF